jgi:hypothetical protein
VLPAQRLEFLGVRGNRRIGELPLDFGRAGERGFQPRFQDYPSFRAGAAFVEYRFRNRSTRPAVSTRRCFPV